MRASAGDNGSNGAALVPTDRDDLITMGACIASLSSAVGDGVEENVRSLGGECKVSPELCRGEECGGEAAAPSRYVVFVDGDPVTISCCAFEKLKLGRFEWDVDPPKLRLLVLTSRE